MRSVAAHRRPHKLFLCARDLVERFNNEVDRRTRLIVRHQNNGTIEGLA
jgi:hypothetical protein